MKNTDFTSNEKLDIKDVTAILIDGFYRLLVYLEDFSGGHWLIHEHKWTPNGMSAPVALVTMINKVGKAKEINSKYWRYYREAYVHDMMPDSEFMNYSFELYRLWAIENDDYGIECDDYDIDRQVMMRDHEDL